MLDNVTKEITPLIATLRKTVASLDTVIAGVNIVLGEDNRNGIKGTIKSINTTADNLAAMTASLKGETENVKGILRNANSFSANLAKNNDTLTRIMANFSNVSNQIAKAPLQKTLTQFDSASAQLNGITAKINRGEGSLGQLINNKDLYTNMTNLLGDLKAHPSRYINVTIFGKKKKD
jgi:phospholipid/cholesterol/gamma-HCH transport system substrate-binding protein